ncbi:hypothetical protein WA158_007258 [Blastocystis sp. Blastoise]
MSHNDAEFMKLAIEEAKKCIPVQTAYNVGAVIVKNGVVLSTGFSRELPGNTHAEECALMKYQGDLTGCVLYSTMEPCSTRLSQKMSCTDRIIKTNIKEVVIGIKEPDHFVHCVGVELLKRHNIQIRFFNQYEEEIKNLNKHIIL